MKKSMKILYKNKIKFYSFINSNINRQNSQKKKIKKKLIKNFYLNKKIKKTKLIYIILISIKISSNLKQINCKISNLIFYLISCINHFQY